MSLEQFAEERITYCQDCLPPGIQLRRFTGSTPTRCDGCGKHLATPEDVRVIRMGDLPWFKKSPDRG